MVNDCFINQCCYTVSPYVLGVSPTWPLPQQQVCLPGLIPIPLGSARWWHNLVTRCAFVCNQGLCRRGQVWICWRRKLSYLRQKLHYCEGVSDSSGQRREHKWETWCTVRWNDARNHQLVKSKSTNIWLRGVIIETPWITLFSLVLWLRMLSNALMCIIWQRWKHFFSLTFFSIIVYIYWTKIVWIIYNGIANLKCITTFW